MNQAL